MILVSSLPESTKAEDAFPAIRIPQGRAAAEQRAEEKETSAAALEKLDQRGKELELRRTGKREVWPTMTQLHAALGNSWWSFHVQCISVLHNEETRKVVGPFSGCKVAFVLSVIFCPFWQS